MQRLRVLRRGAASRPHRGTHHHRNFPFAAGHVVNLRRLVEDLVHGEPHEVAKHDVDNGTHSGHCRANGETGETGFGDWGIEYSVFAELIDQTDHDLKWMAC